MKAISGKSDKDFLKEYPSSEKTYPTLWIREDEIPEVNTWEVGQEYELKIRVKMTNKDEYASGQKTTGRLEIVAYEDITPKVDNDPSTPRQGTSDGYMPRK